MLRYIASSLVLFVIALAAPTPAPAGQDTTGGNSGYCGPLYQSISFCMGSMAGIRDQTWDADAYAAFAADSGGGLTFQMRAYGKDYSCSAPPNMSRVWDDAINSAGSFFIEWDPTGTCVYLAVYGRSDAKNASSL